MSDLPKFFSILWKNKFYSITIPLTIITVITQVLLSGWLSLIGAFFDFTFFALVVSLLLRILRRNRYTFS